MAYVDCNGNICDCMNPTMNGGVRPCIWVQNKSLQFPTVKAICDRRFLFITNITPPEAFFAHSGGV